MTGEARLLADHTWQELPPAPTVLVPVGSTEQHGPHLPLDTDTAVALSVARRVAAGDPAVLLAPAVGYGASGEHEGFAGTISIGHAALYLMIVELGRSASRWAARLLFVNGHGGNLPTLADAVSTLRGEGRDAAWVGCVPPRTFRYADAHAGRTETSIMLALAPQRVHTEPAAAVGNTAPLAELLPALRSGGLAVVSPNGVLGDPTGASAAEGEGLLDAMADAVRDSLARWRPAADGRL